MDTGSVIITKEIINFGYKFMFDSYIQNNIKKKS